MRTSATTDVSQVRAWARACTADGTHLGLRPNQPFGLEHRARLAPEWTQSRTRSASRATCPCARHAARSPSLWAATCYVPARPAAVRRHQRIQRSLTRTSCRGCVGVGRRARSVQCCVRVVAWHGLQAEGGARVADAGGRTSATAASYSARLLRSCAYWRGVRLRRFGPIRWAARRRCYGRHSVTRRRS
jgi:hypothetical protein